MRGFGGTFVWLALGLTCCACDSQSSRAAQARAAAKGAFNLGVNVSAPMYFSGEPVFANLLTGSEWRDPGTGWDANKASVIDARGNITLSAGQKASRILTAPASVMSGQGTTVRCTWEGTGNAWVSGSNKTKDTPIDHGWEFYWPGTKGLTDQWNYVEIIASDPRDPLRNFDCREKDVAKSEVFSAELLESLKPFTTLRFLDWSGVNGNPKDVTWAKRTRADSINQGTAPLGVAIEHMIALANRVDADPWFNVHWNADEDYVRRMAQMVHDGVPAHRHVYVELSNEVWNYSFGQTHQAQAEGLAEGLAPGDGFKSALLRHAEKTRWVMRIWADVFKDRPGQLVRVVATQGSNPWTTEVEVGEAKLAPDVDAVAIAPYFGNDTLTLNKGVTDTAVLLSALGRDMDRVMNDWTQKNADIARKYGLRMIAYEAGQHLIDGDVGAMAAVNRSEGMYDLYKRYIADWKSRFNDTLVLFNSSSQISGWGAWGLREYAGQPLSQTPKRKAAIEMGRHSGSDRSDSGPIRRPASP